MLKSLLASILLAAPAIAPVGEPQHYPNDCLSLPVTNSAASVDWTSEVACGRIFRNEGAAATQTISFAPARVGDIVTLRVVAAQPMRFRPDAGDQIDGTAAAGNCVEIEGVAGRLLQLYSPVAGRWEVMIAYGTVDYNVGACTP